MTRSSTFLVESLYTLPLIEALVEILREHKDEKHFYWGTSYRDGEAPEWRIDADNRSELWGSGYILSMDLVQWISTSDIPPSNLEGGSEDWELFVWLLLGELTDNYVMNRSAFSEYPYPELVDPQYELWNDVNPYGRWIIVTHPLKHDWMWVETAKYYLNLKW